MPRKWRLQRRCKEHFSGERMGLARPLQTAPRARKGRARCTMSLRGDRPRLRRPIPEAAIPTAGSSRDRREPWRHIPPVPQPSSRHVSMEDCPEEPETLRFAHTNGSWTKGSVQASWLCQRHCDEPRGRRTVRRINVVSLYCPGSVASQGRTAQVGFTGRLRRNSVRMRDKERGSDMPGKRKAIWGGCSSTGRTSPSTPSPLPSLPISRAVIVFCRNLS